MTEPLSEENHESPRLSLPVPWLTYGIIGFCGLIFLYFNVGEHTASFDQISSILVPPGYKIWSGAYWAFLITAFVHVDFMHLLFNMWWAKDFGKFLEPTMGRGKYLLFILGAAAAGSGAQLVISGQTGIGFSGVVYAMFGFMMVTRQAIPLYQLIVNQQTIQWMLGWMVLCAVLTWFDFWHVANAAHAAGFVFGYLCGKAFVLKMHVKASWAGIACLGLITIMSAVYVPWSKDWQRRESYAAFDKLRDEAKSGKAEAQFTLGAVLSQYPEMKTEALAWFKKAADQNQIMAMNALAWTKATDPSPNLRNAAESLKWAERACQLDGSNNPAYVDTLAAAYAESERWEEAVAAQRLAMEKIPAQSPESRDDYEKRLNMYLRHEKMREKAQPRRSADRD